MKTLTDIINKVGLENISIQPLNGSFLEMRKKKFDTEITFATGHDKGMSAAKEGAGLEGSHLCLILWIPRNKLA